MDRPELAQRIVQRARLIGQFTLRSGRTSAVYWDKYRFESDPVVLRAIIEHLLLLLPPTYDKLAGLELGGIPLVTGLSLATGRPCLFVRKVAKPYGTSELVEGGWTAGEQVVVVEDVMTSGGQVAISVQQMRDLGLIVRHAVSVIDREEGARERLRELGCDLRAIFTRTDLDAHGGEEAPHGQG
jgi:orotate phosphoribosyltransferase